MFDFKMYVIPRGINLSDKVNQVRIIRGLVELTE